MADDDIFFIADTDKVVSRGYFNAIKHCNPFPNLYDAASGKPDSARCETRNCNLHAHIYYLDYYRAGYHWHPDYTSGICLKKKKMSVEGVRDMMQIGPRINMPVDFIVR